MSRPPSALFTALRKQEQIESKWMDDAPSPAEESRIALFEDATFENGHLLDNYHVIQVWDISEEIVGQLYLSSRVIFYDFSRIYSTIAIINF